MRLLLFIATWSISQCLYAQSIIFENHTDWRPGPVQLYSISDKAQSQVCLVLAANDSIRAFLLDGNANPVKEFAFRKVYGEIVRGGFIRDNKIYLLAAHPLTDKMVNRVLDISTGKVTSAEVNFDIKKDQVLDRIPQGDHFLYFGVNNRKRELVLHDFQNEKEYTTFRYGFNEADWKLLNKGRGDFYAKNVDEKVEYMAHNAGLPGKLLLAKDSLYILMNKESNVTDIFSFDPALKNMQHRSIKHENVGTVTDPVFFSENSFMLDDKLFYVHATGSALNLQIFDFYTGRLIKQYSAEKDGQITFKNTPLMQHFQGVYSKPGRELEKLVQLFRRMIADLPLVLPRRLDNGEVELMVGAFGLRGGMAQVPTGGGGGSVAVHDPDTEYGELNYFRMVVNPSTGEHIPGELKSTVSERIENFTKEAKFYPKAQSLFMIDKQYYHAYYDRKERKLVVVKY
jgi:hypothetical protein